MTNARGLRDEKKGEKMDDNCVFYVVLCCVSYCKRHIWNFIERKIDGAFIHTQKRNCYKPKKKKAKKIRRKCDSHTHADKNNQSTQVFII